MIASTSLPFCKSGSKSREDSIYWLTKDGTRSTGELDDTYLNKFTDNVYHPMSNTYFKGPDRTPVDENQLCEELLQKYKAFIELDESQQRLNQMNFRMNRVNQNSWSFDTNGGDADILQQRIQAEMRINILANQRWMELNR